MNRMLTSMTVLTCLGLVLVPSSADAQLTCKADHQCPSGRFCYETGVCAPCLVCAAYNRLPGSSHCAKEWQGCGLCVKGFASEDIPGAMKRGNCIKASFPSVDPPQPTVGEMYMTTGVPQHFQIAMMVVIVLSLGSGATYLAIKGRQRMRPPRSDVECAQQAVQEARLLQPLPRPLPVLTLPPPGQDTPPPEYRQVALPSPSVHAYPSAPPPHLQHEGARGVASLTGFIDELREEKLQQAVPLDVPSNVRYHWDSHLGEVVAEEVDNEDSQSARSTPVNLRSEESTLPSNWVPSNEDLRVDGSLEDSGVCNVSESASSSTEGMATPHGPLNFQGLFVNGALVTQTEVADAEPRGATDAEPGERPAKRFRADSGSHSADSSSEDETQPGPRAGGHNGNLSFAQKR